MGYCNQSVSHRCPSLDLSPHYLAGIERPADRLELTGEAQHGGQSDPAIGAFDMPKGRGPQQEGVVRDIRRSRSSERQGPPESNINYSLSLDCA